MRKALFLLLIASLLLPAAAAAAQESEDSYTRWNGVRDRFGFHVGGYFVSHTTFARLQPRDVPDIPGVDLESDVSMPKNTADFRLDGYLRLGRRHRVRVGWWEMNRSVVERLKGTVKWQGVTYPVDAEIGARWDTRVVKAEYRYSVFQNERIDVGAALGLFVMKVDTGLGLAVDGQTPTTDTNQSAPLPMLGLDIEYEVAQRWIIRGSGQFFGLSLDDTLDGTWYEVRAGVEYVPFKNFGIGAGYNFAKVDIAIQLDEGNISEFEYAYKINGPHVYAIAVF